MSHRIEHEAGDLLGIVDAVVFALPAEGVGEAWDVLQQAATSGLLLILDVALIEKTEDGVRRLSTGEIHQLGAGDICGAESGLIDDEDLVVASQNLVAGEKAMILMKEDLSFYHVVHAFEEAGAELVADIVVLVDGLEEALEGSE